jgi:mRNA-degrading endonuclease RelE of RelBE toxin-antitoxin system
MNYRFILSADFQRHFKRLFKKYCSLKQDLIVLESELLENPEMGDDLGDNTRKVRMALASKNKGKRDEARVITCNVLINIEDTDIYLLTIYDKGEQDTIAPNEIIQLKRESGLI